MKSLWLFSSDFELGNPLTIANMSGGEHNLQKLLASMDPVLHPEEFVYCALQGEAPRGMHVQCLFREAEASTLITTRTEAERATLPFHFPCRMITLNVHSSLEAVGFLATVASELAKRGISTNVVSAYYHDHFFIPVEKAELAMSVLRELAAR